MLPGAPMRERLPPMAAAKTSGISRRERLNPDLAAMPMTTGIRTAAVPVLERTPLIRPTMTMIAMIRLRSVLANLVTRPPISLAMPVSNRAPPTMNMATKRMTLESMKPPNAVLRSRTLVRTRPTATIIEVRPRGIFSVTNMMIAKSRKSRVIIAGLMVLPPSGKAFKFGGVLLISDINITNLRSFVDLMKLMWP